MRPNYSSDLKKWGAVTMRKSCLGIILLISSAFLVSCAAIPADRYNTQKGALIGAGTGALVGQAIAGNTEGTLIGLAAGTILGALVGNSADQDYQAVRDAAHYGKPVIYYDDKVQAVEAIPGSSNTQQNCRRIIKRVWKDGNLISETVEETCDDPPVVYVPRIPLFLSLIHISEPTRPY